MLFKLGMRHWGLDLYKFYINNDPWLALTYFTDRSNLLASAFEWEKLLESHLMGKPYSIFDYIDSIQNFEKKKQQKNSEGCLPLPCG